ncbi:MAG: LacI family DNA-binding transcriptional regulator [Jhaorihella sp.]
MTQKLTIKSVAKEAGVAVGTVSRVLNKHPAVDKAIREKVEAAIAQLGYQPNLLARSMRQQKSMTIGCIIRDISIPALAAFAKSAQNALFDADYSFVVGSSEGQVDREEKLVRRFADAQIDGLLLSLTTEVDLPYLQTLRDSRLPIVLIDREGPAWADAVVANHESGTRQAVNYLVQLGHKRIALITGSDNTFPARARLKGYLTALRENGVEPDARLIRNMSYLPEYAFSELSALLGQKKPPTAVVAGGMDMMPGILTAIRNSGLEIPQDISVVAASDNDLVRLSAPPIGVVTWDLGEVGRIGARLLLSSICERNVERERNLVIVPTEFLPRSSCATARQVS